MTPAGSTESVTIAESAFIIEYLLDHFANGSTLLPKRYREGKEGQVGGETEEWLRFRYFLHYAEGSLMSLLLISLVGVCMSPLSPYPDLISFPEAALLTWETAIKKSPVPFFIRPITNTIATKLQTGFLDPQFTTHFKFLESQLATSPEGGKYLCGPHLTGADIMLSFALIAARGRAGLVEENYPLLFAYVARLEEEDGYKKAVEKIVEIDGKFEPMIKS